MNTKTNHSPSLMEEAERWKATYNYLLLGPQWARKAEEEIKRLIKVGGPLEKAKPPKGPAVALSTTSREFCMKTEQCQDVIKDTLKVNGYLKYTGPTEGHILHWLAIKESESKLFSPELLKGGDGDH